MRVLKVYDFMCPDGHWFESKHVYPPPRSLVCSCGQIARRMASRFSTFECRDGVTGKAPMDDPKEIFAGTALEGTDGVNPAQFQSTKTQIDLAAAHKAPESVSPREYLRKRLGHAPARIVEKR